MIGFLVFKPIEDTSLNPSFNIHREVLESVWNIFVLLYMNNYGPNDVISHFYEVLGVEKDKNILVLKATNYTQEGRTHLLDPYHRVERYPNSYPRPLIGPPYCKHA